jgi:NAD(P)-dependent dehydrogenase (short-subunit alcohol dehydrogenase family)
MRTQGSGVIVNTSSTAGLRMVATFGAYGPSKAGILALTRLAAQENKDMGIRVNAVCPGPIKQTGMHDRLASAIEAGTAPGGVPPIMGEPDDVARVVIWLCSDEASHVNGNVLSVDGGLDIL